MNCWMCGRFMSKWTSPTDEDYCFFTCCACEVQSSLPGTYRYTVTASRCRANLDEGVLYVPRTNGFDVIPAIDHSQERVMHP